MKHIYLGITAGVLALACVIFAIDRFRLNREFYAIGTKIVEKTALISENEKRYQEKLQEKQQEIDRLNSRFLFVTDVRDLPPIPADEEKNEKTEKTKKTGIEIVPQQLPFAQITDLQEDIKTIQSLVRQVETPVHPENVRRAFLAFLHQRNNRMLPEKQLMLSPCRRRVIDRDAAILEGVCRKLNLSASTTLCWDMEKMERISVTVIKSPIPGDPPATVVCRNGAPAAVPAKVTCQSAPLTVVLPFEPVTLPDNTERELLLQIHEMPVGGLYIQKIDVLRPAGSKAKEWLLEYKIEKETKTVQDKELAPLKLEAFSLLPGTSLTAVRSDDRQTFLVPFVNGKSSLIVFGNHTVIPESVTALPAKQSAPFLP